MCSAWNKTLLIASLPGSSSFCKCTALEAWVWHDIETCGLFIVIFQARHILNALLLCLVTLCDNFFKGCEVVLELLVQASRDFTVTPPMTWVFLPPWLFPPWVLPPPLTDTKDCEVIEVCVKASCFPQFSFSLFWKIQLYKYLHIPFCVEANEIWEELYLCVPIREKWDKKWAKLSFCFLSSAEDISAQGQICLFAGHQRRGKEIVKELKAVLKYQHLY